MSRARLIREGKGLGSKPYDISTVCKGFILIGV